MARVVVTDAEQRAALAVIRALGAAGHEVHVTSVTNHSIGAASKWCSSRTLVPDPMQMPSACAESHRELARRIKADLIVPVGEASALALLDAPMDVEIPLPPIDIFRRLCDKAEVLQVAERVGIRVPRQLIISHRSQLSNADAEGFRYPAVLKPARSVSGDGKKVKLPVVYVDGIEQLRSALENSADAAFPMLLQERAGGRGLGVFHLFWDGAEHATFAHRRLREKPPEGGVSTLRESIALPANLHEKSKALLSALGMTQGVAMVEFKQESEDSDPVLMEINARFWGSLQLAVDSGVNFPLLLVQLALGQSVDSVRTWRTGVRSRWWWGDIDHALLRIRRKQDASGRPTQANWFEPLLDVAFSRDRQRIEEVLRIDDPMPFFRETLNWVRRR